MTAPTVLFERQVRQTITDNVGTLPANLSGLQWTVHKDLLGARASQDRAEVAIDYQDGEDLGNQWHFPLFLTILLYQEPGQGREDALELEYWLETIMGNKSLSGDDWQALFWETGKPQLFLEAETGVAVGWIMTLRGQLVYDKTQPWVESGFVESGWVADA